MRKILLLILVLCITVISVSSCIVGTENGTSGGEGEGAGGSDGGEEGSEGDSGESDDSPETENGETLYYSGSDIMIVTSGEGGSRVAAGNLVDALEENILDTGRAFLGNIYITAEYKNQIIIGYVPEREVSIEAYRLLEEIEKTEGKNESRYVIYADSGMICIAFEENKRSSYQPLELVIESFIKNYILEENQIFFERGVISSGKFDVDILQAEEDIRYTNEKWEYIGNVLGDSDVTESLRGFFENMFEIGRAHV